MDELEHKKLALIRIMEIFYRYSDESHPIKQDEIKEYLKRDYGIIVDRKTIGRNVSLLKESGLQIESTRAGSYIDERLFEDAELRLLIDGVLASKHITAKYSKDLIEKLCRLANIYFRSHVKNIYSVDEWSKSENRAVFYNVDVIDEAIESGKQVKFDYNKFGVDKKLHKTSTHFASPYQLILHNQKYYLMARNERWKNMAFYRIDHITNIEIIDTPLVDVRTVEGYASGINYKELSSSLPYMFTDKPQNIVFYASPTIIDDVIDWFGYDVKIQEQGEKYKITAKVSPLAMEYWALQYLNAVEIVSPVELRQKIKQDLLDALKKYE